ncbi:MAG TPA: hypothetical protein VK625_23270 [Flavitalea sp.]|nr:hypothetical protein [Flavitalea sp.]
MKGLLFLVAACLIILPSCQKESNSSNAKLKETVFQGRFINGFRCAMTSVAVEVVSPKFEGLTDADYIAEDLKTYDQVFGMDIPIEFQDGAIFYFKIEKIERYDIIFLDCLFVPKQYATIKELSRTAPLPPI